MTRSLTHCNCQLEPSLAMGAGVCILAGVRLFFLLLPALALFAGCASKPKSEARIYEGDAPTIRYAPSKAGGVQSVY